MCRAANRCCASPWPVMVAPARVLPVEVRLLPLVADGRRRPGAGGAAAGAESARPRCSGSGRCCCGFCARGAVRGASSEAPRGWAGSFSRIRGSWRCVARAWSVVVLRLGVVLRSARLEMLCATAGRVGALVAWRACLAWLVGRVWLGPAAGHWQCWGTTTASRARDPASQPADGRAHRRASLQAPWSRTRCSMATDTAGTEVDGRVAESRRGKARFSMAVPEVGKGLTSKRTRLRCKASMAATEQAHGPSSRVRQCTITETDAHSLCSTVNRCMDKNMQLRNSRAAV